MADAKTHEDRMEQGGGEWAWWREERNSVTGETRWAVRQRSFIDTTILSAEPTGIPGGFGEIVGTYDTMEKAVARTREINLEINVGMSWGPA